MKIFRKVKIKESIVSEMAKGKKKTSKMKNANKAMVLGLIAIITAFVILVSVTDEGDPDLRAESGGTIRYHPYVDSEEIIKVASGAQYVLPDNWFVGPNGEEFTGWNVNGTLYQPGDTITISGDTEITPSWYPYFTLRFESGEGSGSMADMSIQPNVSKFPNNEFDAPQDKPCFAGWLLDDTVYAPGDAIPAKGNSTAIAQWSVLSDTTIYTVSFDNADVSGSMAPIYVVKDRYIILPNCTFTNGNKVFTGWNIGDNPSTRNIGERIQVTADIVLKPTWGTWDDNTHKGTADDDGTPIAKIWFDTADSYYYSGSGDGKKELDTPVSVSGSMGPFYVKKGTTFITPDNEFVITDKATNPYIYKLWDIYWDQNETPGSYGTRGDFKNKQAGFSLTIGNEHDTVRFAIGWQANPKGTSKVTYDGNGGTSTFGGGGRIVDPYGISVDYPYTAGYEYIIPNNFFERDGYVFDHWSFSKNGGGASSKSPGEKITPISGSGGDYITLTAVWVETANVIRLNPGEASEDVKTVKTNVSFIVPNCPFEAPAGKVFSHWSGNDGNDYDTGAVLDTSVTLTAIWESDQNAVSLEFSAEGKTPVSWSIIAGKNFILPPNIFEAPEGQVFSCWLSNGVKYSPGSLLEQVSADMEFTAVWKNVVSPLVTISYDLDGGEGPSEETKVRAGTVFILPSSGYTKYDGSILSGWTVNGNYCNPDSVITITGDTLLVANWAGITSNSVIFFADKSRGTMNVAVSSSYTLPACSFTAPAGKEFYKWSVSNGGSEAVEKEVGESFDVDGYALVTPLWSTPIQVKFDSGGGRGSMPVMKVLSGIGVFPNNDFEAPDQKFFEGWYVDGTLYQPGDTILFTKDITAIAQWGYGSATKDLVSITFSSNGGLGSMKTIVLPKNSNFLLPNCAFTKDGTTFLKWEVNDGSTPRYYPANYLYSNVQKNLSIKPVWDSEAASEQAAMITFDNTDCYLYDKQGTKIKPIPSTGEMAPYYVKIGDSFTLPLNEFQEQSGEDDVRFKCWAIYKNGQQIYFDKHSDFSLVVDGNLVIKPCWQTSTRTITHNGGGGETTIEGPLVEKPYTLDYNHVLPNNFFSREGYVFDKWHVVQASGDKGNQNPGWLIKGIRENVTITANWLQVASIITLSPGDAGGDSQVILTNANYVLPNCPFERQGYVFSHWSVNSERYNPGDVIQSKNIKDPKTITVTAIWTQTQFTITFKNGEETGTTESVGTGSHYILPENMFEVPEGEEFDCWFANGERKRPGQAITVNSNTEVQVVWVTQAFVTISFDGGEGSSGSMVSVTVENGTRYVLPHPTFAKEGYAFSSWKVGEEYKNIGESIVLLKDTEIVAQWSQENPLSISFVNNSLDSDKVYETGGSEASVVSISSYYGLKATEYNPEYWKGTGEVSSEESNWIGPLAKNRVDAEVNYEVTLQYWLVGTYKIKMSNDGLIKNTINNITVGDVVINPGETRTVSTENRTSDLFLSWDGDYFTFNNSQKSSDELQITINITAQVSYHKVFGGWVTETGEHILPGDVIDWSIEDLYATWVTPDVFVPEKDTINLSNVWPDTVLSTREYTMDVITPYANLNGLNKTLQPILMNYDVETRTYEGEGQEFGNYAYVIPGKDHEYGSNRDGPDMFGTVYHLARERTYNEGTFASKGYYNMNLLVGTPYDDEPTLGYLPAGSYRQPDDSVGDVRIVFKTAASGQSVYDSRCQLGGNVIIDNLGIDGDSASGTHGYSAGSALFANGHILIMGVGLTNPDAGAAGSWKNSEGGIIAPQIFGGTCMTDHEEAVLEDKKIIFSNVDKPQEDLRVDLGSCVIVHSGIYYAIVGGSYSTGDHHSFGTEANPLSTYLVLKGGTTTDTVTGGISGTSANSTLYGSIGGNGRLDGGTFVYLLDHFLPADNWEDKETGYENYKSRSTYGMSKSSILAGGSASSAEAQGTATIRGSTHVFLSGTSNVWDVQAGGRTQMTHADYAYMEISGRAIVRHVACGTITDGAHKSDVNSVNEVDIIVGGDSMVASVFGGGYDTYWEPRYKSMLSGEINVTILGGNVGNVYGGGYRGSVGDGDLTVNVNVLGGTIEQNVYGGGSGGLDKIGHENNGTIKTNYGNGLTESMGRSVVVGSVNVTVGGDATVKGNVYGGGKSVPMLKGTILRNGQNDIDFKASPSWQEGPVTVEVADVVGDVTVTIEGNAKIAGSVYGGGRGIEHTELSNSYTIADVDSMYVISKSDGKDVFGTIRWFLPSAATDYTLDTDNWINHGDEDKSRYLDFAKVHGDTKVVVNGLNSVISGDVFGGSAFGRVEYDTYVDVKSGTMTNVFGGGLGRENLTSTTGTRVVWIEGTDGDYEELRGDKRIYGVSILGSVYGGSKNGNDAKEGAERNAMIVVSRGYIEDSIYGGGFVGKTYGFTDVNIGYRLPSDTVKRAIPMDYTGKDGIVFSRMVSVFAGGNVSDSEEAAYEDYLVMNGGSVKVFGNNTGAVSIGGGDGSGLSGSIMGSGNACLTKGDTSIYLQNFYNASPLYGIHRATTLTLDNSNIKVIGMSPKTDVFGQTKNVSVYHIGTLILKNNSSLAFDDPIDDIGSLKSLTKENQPTTEKTPENRFVFTKGNTIYIRSLANPEDPESLAYNKVDGFTLMVSTSGTYGAYAIALVGSEGGFSVTGDGTMREADTSVSEDGTCCWYVSGIQRKIVTLNLVKNGDEWVPGEGYFSLMKFQPDTDIIYTGGTFTKMSNDPNGDPYSFVRPGSESMTYNPSDLGLAIAYKKAKDNTVTLYDPTVRTMDVGDGVYGDHEGTFFYKGGKESDIEEYKDRSLTSVPMKYLPNVRTAGEFYIYLSLLGNPIDATAYVGYLILNFQEIKEISYGAVDDDGEVVETPRYLIAGTVEVRVDLYIAGSSAAGNNTFTVDVKTDRDSSGKYSGSSSTLIPPSYSLSEVNVVDVSLSGPGSGFMPNVYVSSGGSYTLPLDCGYIPPEGKTFSKWSVNGVEYAPGATISGITEKLTIKPIWTDACEIFYDANGGTFSKDPSASVTCGIQYRLPNGNVFSDTPEDVMLAKWAVTIGSKGESVKNPGDVIDITGDTVIKAVWSDKKKLTYYSGNGEEDEIDVPYGVRIALKDCEFTYADRHFLNWTVEVDDVSSIKYPGDLIYVTDDVDVTANWSSGSTYRISFDANGGSGNMPDVSVALGARYMLPSCTFTAPEHMQFYKWTVSINGGTEYEYLPGQFVSISGNTVVKALWNNEATISFDTNPPSQSKHSIKIAYGTEYQMPEYMFAPPADKEFVYYEISGGGTHYYPGQIITISGDLDLVAVSATPASTCLIVFDANGGTGTMPVLKRASSASYTLPNCEYVSSSGKVFSKWDINGVEKDPGTPITISGDTVIRAKWPDSSQTDRTITIKETAASPSAAKYIVRDGSVFVLPQMLFDAPEGYKYDYWEGYQSSTTITVSSDITLIPHKATVGSDKTLDFDSGVRIKGNVTLKALANPDGTNGWSSIGGTVTWDLQSNRLIDGSSAYIGTLLGVISSNINFGVSDIVATYEYNGSNVSFMPSLDIRMDRSGIEAHTILNVLEKSYYSVSFVDHGIETVRYYEENTILTRENCETPSGNNFNGWYLDSSFVNRYNYNMAINDMSDGTVLYARYVYTVTLDNMNGTTYTFYVSQEDKGALLSESDLGVPVYEGYEFKGWCKDKNLIYDWGYQTDRVTEDITLYARWQGMDVRVYFWYMTTEGLKLFTDGSTESGGKIGVTANDDGQFDLSWAYQMDNSRHIYPTVRWGSTFDVKDQYHNGASILEYAKGRISDDAHLAGTFVRWVTSAPSGYDLSVYDDTIVSSKNLEYVPQSLIDERYGSYWAYYVAYYNAPSNDSPYKRVPTWPSDHGQEPNSMEIHLFAETTNIAIKVSMGLKPEDEKFASTVMIDDPQEFLVYPNGPIKDDTKQIVTDEFGNKYTKVTEGLNTYYLRENGVKYYEDNEKKCWYCIDDADTVYYEFAYKLNKAVRSGYTLTGWHNDYVSINHIMNPSADLVRYVHITVDEYGYASTAKLISKDSHGYEVEIPLLVGDYVVDGMDADSEGNIYIKYEQEGPFETYHVIAKSDGEVEKDATGLHEDDPFTFPVLEPKSGYEFKGWQVKNEIYDNDSSYLVDGSHSLHNGEIIFTAVWEPILTYTVKLYDGEVEVREYVDVRVGTEISLYPLYKENDSFLGWKAKSGMFGDSYVLSVRDKTDTAEIRLDAVWSETPLPTTYDVVFVTDLGEAPASQSEVEVSETIDLPSISNVTTHELIGWRVITGSGQHSVMRGESYSVLASDSDDQHDIIMEAVWSKYYTVHLQTGQSTNSEEGSTINLPYTNDHTKWYVAGDTIVQGSKLTPDAGVPLTMNYRANWDRIEYSVHLEQPANGRVDFYRENADGTSTYYSVDAVNSSIFYYGDKIKLVYTPDSSKVSFIKWVFSGQYIAENIYSNNTVLIIQGETVISVDESTSKILDVMISFDDSTEDPAERNYTRVYMHDKTEGSEGGYYQAKFVPGMRIYDHYVVKVPYGDDYEVCLEYDWVLDNVVHTERYALVGDLVIDSMSPTTLNYVVISAGFINSIPDDITSFVDTEYGPIPEGTTPEEQKKFNFLFNKNQQTGEITIDPNAKTYKLPEGYKFVPAVSTKGHPIVVYKEVSQNQKVVVAKVTKFVGILEDDLIAIAEKNMHINNPDGGTQPVVLSFGPNLEYNTYEGFPWKDGNDQPVFAIETDINLSIEAESNSKMYQEFYLNWVRDDSPADIILQIKETTPSAYVKIDVRMETDDSTGSDFDVLRSGVTYDSSGDDGKLYTIDVYEGYTPSLSLKSGEPITGEVVTIVDGKLKVKSGKTDLQYYLDYMKDDAFYSWANQTAGYDHIHYDPPKAPGNQSWGTTIELPKVFYDSSDVSHIIELWRVSKPVGDGVYVEKDSSGDFKYDIPKADALNTDNVNRLIFIPLLTSDMITISFLTEYRDFEDGGQRLDFTATKGGTIKQYVDSNVRFSLVTDFIDLYGRGGAEYETGIYKFDGFYCDGLLFDKNDSTTVVNSDMVFIAKWTPNDENKKVFEVNLEGKDADISAIKDAFSDESDLTIGAPNSVMQETEITVTVNPKSGYTIDMDRIRGELGYSFVGSDTYLDITVSGSADGSITSWKLWDSGYAIPEGTNYTEYANNAINGFLVYVGGSSVGEGHRVVLVSGSEIEDNLVYKKAGQTVTLSGTWTLWNTDTSYTGSYEVKDADSISGFIVLVKNDFVLKDCTVVYASSDNTVKQATSSITPYYVDKYGSKYEKMNVENVYRYEDSSWVTYKVTDLTGKDGMFIKQFSTDTKAYKMTRDNVFYLGAKVDYTVAIYQGEEAFVKTIAGGGKTYYVDSNGALYLLVGGQYELANREFFSDTKLTTRIVNPAEAAVGTIYSADFVACPEQLGFHLAANPGSDLYGSDYKCIMLSPLHSTLSNIGGSQYKDSFGNVWTKDSQGVLTLRSVTVYSLSNNNTESMEIRPYSGSNPLSAGEYLKDQFGNHIVSNSDAFLFSVLYYKNGDTVVPLNVRYVDQDEYAKSLYENSILKYHIKKNGTLVDTSGKAVSGTLYIDSSCEVPYKGDFIINMVSVMYNALTSYTEGGKSYFKDVFGNKYEDWLGTPTQLPNNRGYTWTFLLKDDLNLTIYTKKISYNIYFILNGTRVSTHDINKVSTVSSKASSSTEYYGADIPQYITVAFDGPSQHRDIKWYTDPAYTKEYDVHNGAVLMDPDKFVVNVTIADAVVAEGHEFDSWKLWGTTEYQPEAIVPDLNAQSATYKGDSNNYFYVFTADWKNETPEGGYKVVLASHYGVLQNNLKYKGAGQPVDLRDFKLTSPGKEFKGWKVWNTGDTITGDTYTVQSEHATTDGFILLVADWGEDITKANNIVYASEYGSVPDMESIRKYQFLADQNISLYGFTGMYVIYLHGFTDDKESEDYQEPIMVSLMADEDEKITIPLEYFPLGDYKFIGWSAYTQNGKRAYTYAPGESVHTSAIEDQIDLYPFYINDGSMVKYYDGTDVQLKVQLDDKLRGVQVDPLDPQNTIMWVRYSHDGPISGIDGMDQGPLEAKHVGDYEVYYYARIMTPGGLGDKSHGNTQPYYEFPGEASLRILQVDAYVIAPSANIRADPNLNDGINLGKIVINSDRSDIDQELLDDLNNTIVTSDDIQLIGIGIGDVSSKALSMDGEVITQTVVLQYPGEKTIGAVIHFVDEEAASKDYNITYINGSMAIYPEDSSKHEHTEYA